MRVGIECATPYVYIYMYVVHIYTCVYVRQCLVRGRASAHEHEGGASLLPTLLPILLPILLPTLLYSLFYSLLYFTLLMRA